MKKPIEEMSSEEQKYWITANPDYYGHYWYKNGEPILPFTCLNCGCRSATNEAMTDCTKAMTDCTKSRKH